MRHIEHDLEASTTEDTFDLVAKSLLLRAGRSTTITWDDLERASEIKCALIKTKDGLVFCISDPALSN